MIYIGVTGWGDHDSLYEQPTSPRDKLQVYASHFPIVEVDASFYAIQPLRNIEKWIRDTPDSFKFIVKAYQGMTGHLRGENPFESVDEMFDLFLQSVHLYKEKDKLAMVLFQFPPWFDCTKENVAYLRYCKKKMIDIPCALEFRHQSWFTERMKEKTLQFMNEEGWIHSICDEPQAGDGSVPTVLQATSKEKTLIRMHGRNFHGWTKPKEGNWREVRYLYRYNEKELTEWVQHVKELEQQSKDIYILFNNNSGGDAADNAKQFIGMLGIEYTGLAPKQLNLF
ncbi:DUF72 domain-containing protein [Bacillus suaedaesalsae]|uniref:DUF72 domain-containing protein n=1 Tax=Bacillus suaedaesalsae TaxID=2810349 RepID=A0ABS2DKC8_9BACI|nr:DUF72 domain-containing protein [Bacillus suaedaesalsae]MBM6618867.1 DUF72 domain-containing protein [Bacillus suaedaesalsae]